MVYKGQKNDFDQFLVRVFTPKIDFEKWVGIPKLDVSLLDNHVLGE